jgi:hypothetical protein
MKRYRAEIVVAAVLVVICAAVWHWEAPGPPLTRGEIDEYLARIERQISMPPAEKADFLARLRAFGENDDGRAVYLLNLMRFHAALHPAPGLPADYRATPAEANDFYNRHVAPVAVKRGAYPIFIGTVRDRDLMAERPEEDGWSQIGLMHNSSRRAFLEFMADPAYAPWVPYKVAALHLALVAAETDLLLPDVRLLVAGLALIVFLGFGWFRAARRNRGGREPYELFERRAVG